ncbi:hypothetical protein GW626_17305 [Peribacillus muralis]|uniref:hypothetical protein n=1 Tax=Peribacillus muralis TaxID=264697 RepID=UPI001F4EC694|nr:hypothetical protein [Peribacillus muralis]MCK1992112.1 hypothetical protein [Peribacillus muralis]MCK2012668.1 hypothetical protein [Peribacillus muralis]
MKNLSRWSIVFAVIGTAAFGCYFVNPKAFDFLIFGFGSLLLGLILSFGAMFKNEKGKTKFLAVAVFFLFGFFLVWNEPFQVIRLLTWMRN